MWTFKGYYRSGNEDIVLLCRIQSQQFQVFCEELNYFLRQPVQNKDRSSTRRSLY